jgi:hypothetical protein
MIGIFLYLLEFHWFLSFIIWRFRKKQEPCFKNEAENTVFGKMPELITFHFFNQLHYPIYSLRRTA